MDSEPDEKVKKVKKKRGKPAKKDPTSKSLVYKYGTWRGPRDAGVKGWVTGPVVGAEAVDDQARKSCQYRRDLIKIDQERRKQIREALEHDGLVWLRGLVEDTKSDVDQILMAIKAERKKRVADVLDMAAEEGELTKGFKKSLTKAAARRHTDPVQAAALKQAREKLKEARERLRLGWSLTIAANPGTVEKAREVAAERAKALKKGAGVYWGTSSLATQAAFKSASSVPFVDADGKFSAPRWGDEHKVVHVSVQIQHGEKKVRGPATAEDLFKPNPIAWIKPVDPRAWNPDVPRGERKKLSRTMLHMVVDSYQAGPKKDRRPTVWASFPITMHRPIPPEAKIKQITMTRRLVADKHDWTCEISIELPCDWKSGECGTGPIAVAIGWSRKEDGSVVVATAVRADGRAEELVIPGWQKAKSPPSSFRLEKRARSLQRLAEAGHHVHVTVPDETRKGTRIEYPNALRSVRDRNLDEVRSQLAALLKNDPRAKDIAYWRKPAKFARLARLLREEDPSSPAAVIAERWRKQDKHLWTWEVSQRSSAQDSRKDLYRRTVAGWLKTFGEIVIDDTSYSSIAQYGDEEDEEENRVGQKERVVAAPSELRTVIQHTAARVGAKVTTVKAAGTAVTCPSCLVRAKHRTGSWFQCHGCLFAAPRAQIRAYNMLRAAGHESLAARLVQEKRACDERLRKGEANESSIAAE